MTRGIAASVVASTATVGPATPAGIVAAACLAGSVAASRHAGRSR